MAQTQYDVPIYQADKRAMPGRVDSQTIKTGVITSTHIKNGTIQREDVKSDFKAPLADTSDYSRNPGGMSYPGAGIPLSTGSAWGTPITNNSANWNTSYTDRLKWDGGATDLVAATGRTSLGLVIGTNVQAYDADLTTYAGITPSSNVQSYLAAANYAAMQTLLGLVIGTNVQAYNSNLNNVTSRRTPAYPYTTNVYLRGDSTFAGIPGTENASKIYYVSSAFSGATPYYKSLVTAWHDVASDSITIILYPGVHKINHFIGWDSSGVQYSTHRTPYHNITIKGFGKSSVVLMDSTAGSGNYMYSGFYFDGGSNVTLKDFSLDLKGATYSTNAKPKGLEMLRCSGGVIDGVMMYNGNNVQDKTGITAYYCGDLTVTNCDFIDVDCGVYVADRWSRKLIITNNRLKGGKSEGIWVGSESRDLDSISDGYVYPTNVQSVVIANNIIEDKNTSCINIQGYLNASISITGNVINRSHEATYIASKSKGIFIEHCKGVTVTGNTYNGNYYGGMFNIYNCEDIVIEGNIGRNVGGYDLPAVNMGYEIGVFNGGTAKNKHITFKNNILVGLRSAPIWNATRPYAAGEVVGNGNQDYFYICKVNHKNQALTNTTYWTLISDFYCPLIRAYGDDITIEGNKLYDHHKEAIWIDKGGMDGLHINDNIVKNCMAGIVISLDESGYGTIDVSGNYDFDDLRINGNTVTTNDSGGNGTSIKLKGIRKVTNSWIENNTFKSEYATNPPIWFSYRWVENFRMKNNNFGGNPASTELKEYYAIAKKSENVLLGSGTVGTMAWGSAAGDTAIGGWVEKGEIFNKVFPASNIRGYVCTTAGNAYRETYNIASTYQVGEHVVGSDGKIYICILYDTGETANAPITGGSWATYWVIAPSSGSKAVFTSMSY